MFIIPNHDNNPIMLLKYKYVYIYDIYVVIVVVIVAIVTQKMMPDAVWEEDLEERQQTENCQLLLLCQNVCCINRHIN